MTDKLIPGQLTDVYCPLPFKHAYIDNIGVSACCISPRYQMPLKDWSTSKQLIDMQQSMLNNVILPTCQKCHQNEKQFGESLRLAALRDYNNQLFVKSEIDFIDYRSSNICNFKCRSCSPTFSHGIANEVKSEVKLQKHFQIFPSGKTLSLAEEDQKWISDNLGNINRLMLTGGEPTVIPKLKDIVKLIVDKYADNINLMITSNLSFDDPLWYTITTTLPNIHWTASIDAVGAAAEIIRHGTKWPVVEKNLRWLATNAASLNINTVVTNLNLFHLDKVLMLGKEMQELSMYPTGRYTLDGCRHQFAVSSKPYMLAVDNLPPELADRATPYLNSCLSLDLTDEQRDTVNGLINTFKDYKFDPALWERFKEYNNTLDALRNEDHWSLFRQ